MLGTVCSKASIAFFCLALKLKAPYCSASTGLTAAQSLLLGFARMGLKSHVSYYCAGPDHKRFTLCRFARMRGPCAASLAWASSPTTSRALELEPSLLPGMLCASSLGQSARRRHATA
eukprot:CAMPEP_0177560256 /NCGR_PEP_ID=MMETSP0369-20130122/71278_1 /TAXON_ID=447022 ORGANISM="Scrippsiella hangoei-like, Strain SHHI-4" /NCGR_SAMPLE_ID=MMETSP0369 /ASSEMBLY_ACC=CAM_ASM_000364 /LENGTH=117 /DNA_ID=CAMNT_0019047051 /DNA_START=1 /DNA_END=354 /DNA_ORIENTATION=+